MKKKILIPMLMHIAWGGWNNIVRKRKSMLILSKEKIMNYAKNAHWDCEQLPEDLTYSNSARTAYLLTPVGNGHS